MAKLVKASKKSIRSGDDFYVKQIIYDERVPSKNEKIESVDEGDDDAPEAVSLTTSKAEIISQIKSEREARRLEKEKSRQKALALQSQNRQARSKKVKEAEILDDQISGSEDEKEKKAKESVQITPLPEKIFEAAIPQKIQFESSEDEDGGEFDYLGNEDEESFLDSEEIRETIRQTRAKVAKRRLVQSLPYSVVEVGVNGKSRISREELKARRKISKSKIEMTGREVRRIDSILDRARRNRTVPAVFSRKNSFY